LSSIVPQFPLSFFSFECGAGLHIFPSLSSSGSSWRCSSPTYPWVTLIRTARILLLPRHHLHHPIPNIRRRQKSRQKQSRKTDQSLKRMMIPRPQSIHQKQTNPIRQRFRKNIPSIRRHRHIPQLPQNPRPVIPSPKLMSQSKRTRNLHLQRLHRRHRHIPQRLLARNPRPVIPSPKLMSQSKRTRNLHLQRLHRHHQHSLRRLLARNPQPVIPLHSRRLTRKEQAANRHRQINQTPMEILLPIRR